MEPDGIAFQICGRARVDDFTAIHDVDAVDEFADEIKVSLNQLECEAAGSAAEARQIDVRSEFEVLGLATRLGELRSDRGHGEILQTDTGAVEERDLLG